jgi:hypothetical protein
MFFLAGSAAASALDLISTLQKTLGKTSAPQAPKAQNFDPASLTDTVAPPAPASGGPAPPLAPATMNAMLSVQSQGQGSPLVNGNAFSAQLFSLLDGNNDGAVSKSELETAFGQNGNTAKADGIFAKLDANQDGNVSPDELINALDGQTQGQGQGQSVQGAHHHRHHRGGMDALADAMAGPNGGGSSNDAQGSSDTSQSVTNSDGSTTTTISYADGSQVTMTIPGAGGTGASPAATAHNSIERMIQRQAQMLAASSAGQSFAMSV